MSKKKPSTGRSNAVESHKLEDGAFELVVDDVAESVGTGSSAAPRPAAGESSGSKSRVGMFAIGGVAVLGIGAAVAVSLMLGGDQDGETVDAELEEVPSFRAYDGTGAARAPTMPPKPAPRADDDSSGWQVEERGDEILVNGEPVEADWRGDETSVIDKEIDGERILRDNRGEPMSKIEAQIRAQKMVDSIDNSEHDFERRMRVRDAMNSRIMVPSRAGLGSVEVAPGVHIGEGLQQKLIERYGGGSEEATDSVAAEDEAYVEEEFYDEEYLDEEEYLDDEEYLDEEDGVVDEEWDETAY